MSEKTRVSEGRRMFPSALFTLLVGGFVLATTKPITALGLFDRRKDFYASCSRCYFCVQVCPVNAFVLDKYGFPHIRKDKCMVWNNKSSKLDWGGCGLCYRGCPTRALNHLNSDQYRQDREDPSSNTTVRMPE